MFLELLDYFPKGGGVEQGGQQLCSCAGGLEHLRSVLPG